MLIVLLTISLSVLSQTCVNPLHEGEFLNHYKKSFAVNRLLVLSDVHSDVVALKQILKFSQFTKSDTLVVLGDAICRGHETRQTLDFLMSTTNLLYVLGNHEHLNLLFQFSYVTDQDLLSFNGVQDRVKAFSPEGLYGEYLLRQPVAARVGDLVMVHAGISLRLAEKFTIDEMNQKFMTEYLVHGPFGPLWYRAFAARQEPAACPELGQVLEKLDARFMVMGHSLVTNVTTRCKGKAVFVDTGISSAYNGTLAALEVLQIDGRTVRMVGLYGDRQEVIYEMKVYE